MPEFAIDLGLPSGRLWADRNVGAASPEDYGDYFAWGETAPRGADWATSKPYNWANTPFNGGSSSYDAAYFDSVKNDVCPGGVLDPDYDAAHVIMGGNWRMPTSTEIQELINGTTQKVEEVNGILGTRFTSKAAGNTNSIFMPIAGYRYGSDVDGEKQYGCVWSSSLLTGGANSYYLEFSYSGSAKVYDYNRYTGCTVRGVC